MRASMSPASHAFLKSLTRLVAGWRGRGNPRGADAAAA